MLEALGITHKDQELKRGDYYGGAIIIPTYIMVVMPLTRQFQPSHIITLWFITKWFKFKFKIQTELSMLEFEWIKRSSEQICDKRGYGQDVVVKWINMKQAKISIYPAS